MEYEMRISYELRTMRDARIFSYDNLARAKDARGEAEKKVGVKMKIVKITHMEEVCDD
jgi:hypothetical protein